MDLPTTVMELVLNEDMLADQQWVREHWTDLQQYQNMWIAVSGGEVVAFGKDPDEVDRLAQEKTGKTEYQIPLVFVEDASCIYWEMKP